MNKNSKKIMIIPLIMNIGIPLVIGFLINKIIPNI